jgi:hypothetical protein
LIKWLVKWTKGNLINLLFVFKKHFLKNIILMYFWVKNILKNNCNHTLKYSPETTTAIWSGLSDIF